MGPLFSLALVAVLGLCATLVCFVGAVFFLPARRAAVAAIIATLGGGVGVVLAAVAAVPFVGIGQTLSSRGAVMAYVGALACGGVVGGIAPVVFYLRRTANRGDMRSNKSFDTDAQRRSFASLRSSPPVAGQLRR